MGILVTTLTCVLAVVEGQHHTYSVLREMVTSMVCPSSSVQHG